MKQELHLILADMEANAIFSDGGYKFTEEDKETLALGRRSPAISFSRNMCEVQLGRQLFSTAAGRFGFGNVGIRKGDLVCIFNGAVTPNVLRKARGESWGNATYTLVAQAYIHRMMNGELQELGLERRDICLV